MPRRRTLLAALPPAVLGGCVEGLGSSCSGPTITEVDAEYDVVCTNANEVHADVTVHAPDCDQTVTLAVPEGFDDYETSPRTVPAGGELRETVYPSVGGSTHVTIQVLTAEGDVADERSIEVDRPDPGPPAFRIHAAEIGADRIGVGEPVTATVDVRNRGAAGDVAVALRSEEETLTTAERRLDAYDECHGPGRTRVQVSAALDEPGEYPLSVAVEAADESGSGDVEELGAVVVEGDD